MQPKLDRRTSCLRVTPIKMHEGHEYQNMIAMSFKSCQSCPVIPVIPVIAVIPQPFQSSQSCQSCQSSQSFHHPCHSRHPCIEIIVVAPCHLGIIHAARIACSLAKRRYRDAATSLLQACGSWLALARCDLP